METPRVTLLLREIEGGSAEARERLLEALHGELRRMARARMRGQRASHTLQPTALVHEAYLRLFAAETPSFTDRTHFLSAASRAMRSVLVDMARRRSAEKRGGGRLKVTFHEGAHAEPNDDVELLDLDEALDRLADLDPRWASVVEMRFFGGLTVPETAAALGVSEPTVKRAWDRARTWLYEELSG